MSTTSPKRMSLVDCVSALHAVRHEAIVITTMGAAREWQKLGKHPLDFVLVPSSMGQATSLGLGMALARPDRKVVVCNGDGSMLMNLGSLVTISAQSPANLTVIVFDNGVYEVTGGQPTLAAAPLRHDVAAVNFGDLARACGFRRVSAFDTIATWRENVRRMIDEEGPTFVHLLVEPVLDAGLIGFPGPSPDRARTFREQLMRAESGRA
jgi:thiamine pyrophosphate-dependent acetolactate synthase large subunit-like protein